MAKLFLNFLIIDDFNFGFCELIDLINVDINYAMFNISAVIVRKSTVIDIASTLNILSKTY